MQNPVAGLIVLALILLSLLGGTCIKYVLAATRLREELERRDEQIQKWGQYFLFRSQRGVTWPEVLVPIGRESVAAGSLLAWLARASRVRDTERLLLAAHQLGRDPRTPESLEEWRSLGAADLGDEFFQTALADIAKVLQAKAMQSLGIPRT